MKGLWKGIAFWVLVLLPLTTADLYITELMHSPTQVADSEGEWVEIYNAGAEILDLSTWTIDGKPIGNRTMLPQTYLVIARELLDGEDTDTQSFESYWGNNNGVWDENFAATEVSLSLKEDDSIILTNGLEQEEVIYNASFGGQEGKTIERTSLTEWQEGPSDGTPGFGNFSTLQILEETNAGNEIYLYIDILNSPPEIVSINMTDDAEQEGIQILPILNDEKQVQMEVVVNDTDGFADVQQILFSTINKTGTLTFERNTTATAALYTGNFSLDTTVLAGDYNLMIEVLDKENSTMQNLNFTYEGIVSTELNVTSFTMSMRSGETAVQTVQLLNSGNVIIDTEISAEDLHSETEIIPKSSLEVFEDVWLPLADPVFLDLNVAPQNQKELQFRFKTPQATKSGHYEGKIIVTSMESQDAE